MPLPESHFSSGCTHGGCERRRAELIKTVRADAQVRTALGLPQRIGEEQRGQLEAVFQGMDTDDSRGVDVDEFVAFMRAQFGGGAARGKVEEWDEVRRLASCGCALWA